MKVPASILPPPIITWAGSGRDARAVNMASYNLQGAVFKGSSIGSVVILRFYNVAENELDTLGQGLFNAFKVHGMLHSGIQIFPDIVLRHSVEDIETALKKHVGQNRFLFIVLPKKDIKLYSKIKYVADRIALRTTCVVSDKVTGADKKWNPRDRIEEYTPKPGAQYCSNVVLKMCYRSGGVPFFLKGGFPALNNTLVLGADVSHDGTGSNESSPSVAAVVGSMNGQFVNYPGEMRLIPNKQEVRSEPHLHKSTH